MPTPSSPNQHEQRSSVRKTLTTVVTVLVLAWAWQVSGLSQLGKLWVAPEPGKPTVLAKGVNYIFGQPIDETTLQNRREEALRDIRTSYQTKARERIEADMKAKGQPLPGVMTLMKLAEDKGVADMNSADPAEIDRRVQEILREQGLTGSRRGGFFPPETSPKAVFGDPDRLGKMKSLHWPFTWIERLADSMPAAPRSAARWSLSAIVGDGYTGALLETIAIALWGTLIAVFIAVPASLLGSQRTLEIMLPGSSGLHTGVRWFGKFIVRRSFDFARGFNEVVLALILVAVLGLGPLPGVLALVIHTYGVLGKVFADALETADNRPIEGVQSTGAGWSQVISFAVLPQIMPYIASQSLLRLESNVRGATILGVVGAGGIGQLLMDKFGAYEFREVCTMMIIIIVVVTLIDFACGRIMKRLV